MYFGNITLKELGLNIQLGHSVSEKCCRPQSVPRDEFLLVHINGIHVVSLTFCRCETAETHSCQLLCMWWLPTTFDKPHTAATFHVLENFHILSLESKLSCYEFYNALLHCSDNTSLNPPKVCLIATFQFCMLSLQACYEQFLRLVCQWHHLKLLKHSGWGHDPNGILNTKEGECAVLCLACPQPGKNMVISSLIPRYVDLSLAEF